MVLWLQAKIPKIQKGQGVYCKNEVKDVDALNINIKGLEKIFEKNLSDDYLRKALAKIITYEISKTRQELRELKKDLKAYEKRFNMSSKNFFKKFLDGDLEDSADFFEWSSLYRMYLRSSERLDILRSE